MMTRGQVAKRVGVSVAAVRKFEGSELHPEMQGGCWIFDTNEVEGLASLRAHGGGRLTTPFDALTGTNLGSGSGLDDPSGERGDVAVAMPPRADQDSRPVAQERSITKQESGAAMREQLEEQQFVSTVGDLLSELEGLSPRRLSRFMRQDAWVEQDLIISRALVELFGVHGMRYGH
jgi:hypothetical protein